MQRERQIISGKLMEVDFYPIWNDGRRMPTRAPKTRRSTEAQQKYNLKQSALNYVRKINANFDTGDVFMHVTYSPVSARDSADECEKDMYNFIRRVRALRKKEYARLSELLKKSPKDTELKKRADKLSEPLRYCYVMEEKEYKSGSRKGSVSRHFHVFLTGGIDRDRLEDMWGLGVRVNADRYQPERFGLETAAKYCAKDPKGRKRFCCSRNLRRPQRPKPKDGRISARGVERMAKQRTDDVGFWENRYKGYRFVRCFSRFNEYNGQWYVSVVMYKSECDRDIPPWNIDKDMAEMW